MPSSKNITTVAGLAFEVPQGALGYEVWNETDTDILIAEDRSPSASTTAENATRGKPIVAAQDGVPTYYSRTFLEPLTGPLQVHAIHAGGGSKVLTWDTIRK